MYSTNVPPLPDTDVENGQIIGDFHGHIPTGVLKGWSTDTPFEIDEEMFTRITDKLCPGEQIINKMGILMAHTTSIHDTVSTAIVVYQYDHSYYMLPVFHPAYFGK